MQTELKSLDTQEAQQDGETELLNYNRVLQSVLALSPELRAMLVQQAVASLVQPRPRNTRAIIDRIENRPRGNQPPPTDAEVEQWIEEHRMERYA
ncbi:MAG: hypothetical protein DLM69_09250 [Candidatus Chloroheliales bacterium]|nr:MAG: hypothetical protein DLM69_09250 [Chloroflexota bacterium]